MAGPQRRRQPPQQQGLDLNQFRNQIVQLRADYEMLIQQQPLPRQDLENMRTLLHKMAGDLANHVRTHQPTTDSTIARRELEGLLADLDHTLYGRTMPQQPPGQQPQQQQPPQQGPSQQGQTPGQRTPDEQQENQATPPHQPPTQGRPPRRQPRLPVPRRAPAPPRTMTYDISIGPLPHQQYRLTLPQGETIQSLYSAAVQRGQVVEREAQAGALRLEGNPVTQRYINGQIPPAEANALGPNPSERDMLSLLLDHECFSLPPQRSPAGGDYTMGGAGHIPGFDVSQIVPSPGMVPNPTRSTRLDTFHDNYLDQVRLGAQIRVALAPPQPQGPATQPGQNQPGPQPGTRRRRG